MKIQFTKMHGLGNDFVIIDAINQQIELSPENIRFIANRHLGIGCDQILLVLPPLQAKVDFAFRIFNSDGSEAEQSGNGMRCLAKFVTHKKLIANDEIIAQSLSGRSVKLHLQKDGTIAVDMGIPIFDPKHIPFVASGLALRYNLQLENMLYEIGAVSFGNPHAVIKVDNVSEVDVSYWGKKISTHESFPQGVNVGFMQVVSRDKILLRVYERGTGETLACGSGSCAAVAVGRLWQLLSENVLVQLSGGSLTVSCQNLGSSVILKGPAVKVFDGELDILSRKPKYEEYI